MNTDNEYLNMTPKQKAAAKQRRLERVVIRAALMRVIENRSSKPSEIMYALERLDDLEMEALLNP